MALEDSGLMREVESVMLLGSTRQSLQWRCRIYAGDDVVIPLKVLSLDIVRDYTGAYADRIMLQIALGAGAYNHRLYPNRDALKVEVYCQVVAGNEEGSIVNVMGTYRGLLINLSSQSIESNTSTAQSEYAEDISNIMTLDMQLADETLESIRLQTVGGIFQNVTPAQVLRQLLTRCSQQISMDTDTRVSGVEMIAPDNSEVRRQIVVPHGTPLVDLADFLQVERGGIYASGIGCYLLNRIWYVFPEFNLKRFDTTPRTLTVINLPANRMAQIENTYRRTSNQVIILATAETRQQDESERRLTERGNGVRYADARQVIKGMSTTQGNRTTFKRGESNSEYVAFTRPGGKTNAPMSKQRITDNPFVQTSALANRKGSLVQIKWENAEVDLLYPGMPVRFVYTQNNRIEETYGVLHGEHYFIHDPQPGLAPRGHLCNAALTFFLDNDIDWDEATVTA